MCGAQDQAMTEGRDQMREWRHAYRVLDMPESASPREIKAAYRHLVRRWHPDRYPSDSAEQREATRMTEMINSAYAVAETAPLHKPALARKPRPNTRMRQTPAPAAAAAVPQAASGADPLGFWVRFAFGALFGALLGLRFVFYAYVSPSMMIIGMAMMILICAFAAGFGGDKLQRLIRQRR
jgi:preprotein translocase subunit Sec63